MAALDIVTVPVNGGIGLEDSATPASSGGDTAPVGPGRFLYVMNGDAAPHTATVATPGTASGLPLPEVAVVVPAGESAILPLTPVFRGVGGRASITYDAVTAVSVAAFELER